MSEDEREEILTHLPAMRAFARSLTQNSATADDIVQDAVIKAWTNYDKFEKGSNLRAWLFTILRNTFFSYRRKLKHEVEDVDNMVASTLSTRPEHDGRLAMNDLLKALRLLSIEQREAIVLIGALGFGYEEAAELCDVPVGTIKSRANRAREQLANLMENGFVAAASGSNPAGQSTSEHDKI